MRSQVKDPIKITCWGGSNVIIPKSKLKDIPFFRKFWEKNPEETEFQILYEYQEFKYIMKHMKDDWNYYEGCDQLQNIFDLIYNPNQEEILVLSVSGWYHGIKKTDLLKSEYFESYSERWEEFAKDKSDEYDYFVDEEPESFWDILKFLQDPKHVIDQDNIELAQYYTIKGFKEPEPEPEPEKKEHEIQLPVQCPPSQIQSRYPTGIWSKHLNKDLLHLSTDYYILDPTNSGGDIIQFRATKSPIIKGYLLIKLENFDQLLDSESVTLDDLYDLIKSLELIVGGHMFQRLFGPDLKVLEEAFHQEDRQSLIDLIKKNQGSYLIPLRFGYFHHWKKNQTGNHFYHGLDLVVKINPISRLLKLGLKPIFQLYLQYIKTNTIVDQQQLADGQEPTKRDRNDVDSSIVIVPCSDIYLLKPKSLQTKINIHFCHLSSGLIITRISKDDPSKYLPITKITLNLLNNMEQREIGSSLNNITKYSLGLCHLDQNIYVIPFSNQLKEIYHNPENIHDSLGLVNWSRIDTSTIEVFAPDDNLESSLYILNLSYNIYRSMDGVMGPVYCT